MSAVPAKIAALVDARDGEACVRCGDRGVEFSRHTAASLTPEIPNQSGLSGRIGSGPGVLEALKRGLTIQIDFTDWRATLNGTRPCTVPNCTRPPRSSVNAYCEVHYYRVRRNGTTVLPIREPKRNVCTAEGCDKIVRGRGLCSMHYKRLLRNGDLVLRRVVSPPRAARGTCAVDDCEKVDEGVAGLCKAHAARMRRYGQTEPVAKTYHRGPDHANWDDAGLSYHGAHLRLKTARGRAKDAACADCGRQAAQWSYDHTDPDERQSEYGPFSIDPAFYVARCVPCHKRFDLAAIRANS